MMQQFHPRSQAGPYVAPEGHDPFDSSMRPSQPFVKTTKRKYELYTPPYFFPNAASFIFCIAGAIFFYLSFGGTAWYVVPRENTIIPKTFGLWRLCVRTECVVDMTNEYMVKKYLQYSFEADESIQNNPEVIQAFEHSLMPVKVVMCVAFVTVFVALICNILFILGYATYFLEAVVQLFSGILIAVAIGIFGGNFRDDDHEAPFGWSFWCGVISGMIFIVNGIAMTMLSLMIYRQRGSFVGRK